MFKEFVIRPTCNYLTYFLKPVKKP